MKNLIFGVQHTLNPLHVYCRLVGIGLDTEISFQLSRYYEGAVYSKLFRFTNYLYRCLS
ncbi:MAG: hypothetical protein SWH78_03090 [Thermodesulfobacteriota bacterium]|nr:hypothetical protein [Thermodesulfobacteriota bacterium]